jgi:predicted nucleotide-binding protein
MLSDGDLPVRNATDRRRVFVVHGRNEELRKSVFAFLRALGLSPIEWSEALSLTGKPSPYIGEVLDAAFATAQAVVVVLSTDDEVRLSPNLLLPTDSAVERERQFQARPNVLFEAGMAFGRHSERTVLVEVGRVKQFSDIGGRHVVRLDNGIDSRTDVADRLETAGCQVSRSGRDWHREGNFEIQSDQVEGIQPLRQPNPDRSAEPSETLPKETPEVLTAVSAGDSCMVEELAEHLAIHREKARFLLDELTTLGMLDHFTGYGFAPESYSLSKKGRKWMIQKGMLD